MKKNSFLRFLLIVIISAILRFVNDGGDEEFLKFHYSHGLPVVGEYYNIVYAVKPSGKILAELIDMKIN